jgi:hypothetical protein
MEKRRQTTYETVKILCYLSLILSISTQIGRAAPTVCQPADFSELWQGRVLYNWVS